MSETYCSLPLEYADRLGWFSEGFWHVGTYSLEGDDSISIPLPMREDILVTKDILEIFCFVKCDDLDYPYSIHCFHPQNTALLRNLLATDHDNRFLATIDKTYRLHIPIDTLKRIGITKKVLFMTHNGFSWSIVCPKQEQLSFKPWRISIPEAVPAHDTDR
jgi:hypothetical protein